MQIGGNPQCDRGVRSMTKPLTMIQHDGTRIDTRGSVVDLKETGQQYSSAFSKSGTNCWVPFTVGKFDPKQIGYVERTPKKWRVLDREILGKYWLTCRFQLIQEGAI